MIIKKVIFRKGIIPDPDPVQPPIPDGNRTQSGGRKLTQSINDECNTGMYTEIYSLRLDQNIRDWITGLTEDQSDLTSFDYILSAGGQDIVTPGWYVLENPSGPKIRTISGGQIDEIRICP